jgi:hypothetical protein
VSVARAHRSDAGLPASMGPAEVTQLSRFLIAHQGAGRYEVVSPTVVRAAPLIIHDARPVLMLTSFAGRPLMGAGTLKRLVAAGDARYALLGRGSCPSRARARCAAVVRWAVAHGRDVGARAGLPPGVVYRLSTRTASRRVTARRGGAAARAGRRGRVAAPSASRGAGRRGTSTSRRTRRPAGPPAGPSCWRRARCGRRP